MGKFNHLQLGNHASGAIAFWITEFDANFYKVRTAYPMVIDNGAKYQITNLPITSGTVQMLR